MVLRTVRIWKVLLAKNACGGEDWDGGDRCFVENADPVTLAPGNFKLFF